MDLPVGQVLVGDMRIVLPDFAEASIDAGTCDPPYELNLGGAEWDRTGVAFDPQAWRAYARVLKPGAHMTVFGGSRSHHRVWCAIEDAGLEIRDTLIWAHSQSITHASDMAKVLEREGNVDEAERERFVGRAAGLRPVLEPICLVRKPIEGTLLENLRRYGTGVLNIDACRTVVQSGDRPGDAPPEVPQQDGRWPTNFVLSHAEDCVEDGPCAEGCPVRDLDAQSGIQRDGIAVKRNGSNFDPNGPWGKLGFKPVGTPDSTYGSSGGASRYYPVFRYCAKPSRAERDMGLQARNPHATVKPLSLIRWLVRLVTPPGGVVLDAFVGSGTTLAAAEIEGRQWIGIDLSAEFAEIARARALAGAEQAGTVTAEQARVSKRTSVQVGLFGNTEEEP